MPKKDIRPTINPMAQFTQPATPARQETPAQPEAIRISAEKPETKSKRYNLLLYPSLYMKLKERAEETGISINDLINQVLTAFIEK